MCEYCNLLVFLFLINLLPSRRKQLGDFNHNYTPVHKEVQLNCKDCVPSQLF